MALDKIHVGHSPLTNNINLYRMGKSATAALESRPVTQQVIGAVIEHVMHDAPNGATLTVGSSDGKTYELTVRPVDAATPAA